jgi:hypothetical protein
LTRAAQADLSDRDQLLALALYGSMIDSASLDSFRREESQESPQKMVSTLMENYLQELRDCSALCYLLLSDMAEGCIHKDVIFWINDNSSRVNQFLGSGGLAKEDTIPLHEIQIVYTIRGGGIRTAFAEEVRTLLTQIISVMQYTLRKDGEPLPGQFAARCEECASPFVIGKKGQRFCSVRCAARLGARRRRGDEKSMA